MQRSDNRSYPEWTKIYPKTFPGQVNDDRGHENYEYTSPARPMVDSWEHDDGHRISRVRLFESFEQDEIELDGPKEDQPDTVGWKITVTNPTITSHHDIFDEVAMISYGDLEGQHWIISGVAGREMYDRINEWRYRNQS